MCLSEECRHDTPTAPDGAPEFQQKISPHPGPEARRRFLICPACHWGSGRVGAEAEGATRRCPGPGCRFEGRLPGYDVDNAN